MDRKRLAQAIKRAKTLLAENVKANAKTDRLIEEARALVRRVMREAIAKQTAAWEAYLIKQYDLVAQELGPHPEAARALVGTLIVACNRHPENLN